MLFAPTKTAVGNLEMEGLSRLTYLTGDTIVDTLRIVAPFVKLKQSAIQERLRLTSTEYVLVTMHRPSNVDDLNRLRDTLIALREVARKIRIVFPAHPRTRSSLARLRTQKQLAEGGITLTGPQGYIETLSLLKNANCLLTDSGGMQKESFLFHVPCVTLRSTTEWPETLVKKANRLIFRPDRLAKVILSVAFNEQLRQRIRELGNPFGDGHASRRILHIIEEQVKSAIP
jgi:UDP-N-acetylglucosamine 2-epimerase